MQKCPIFSFKALQRNKMLLVFIQNLTQKLVFPKEGKRCLKNLTSHQSCILTRPWGNKFGTSFFLKNKNVMLAPKRCTVQCISFYLCITVNYKHSKVKKYGIQMFDLYSNLFLISLLQIFQNILMRQRSVT